MEPKEPTIQAIAKPEGAGLEELIREKDSWNEKIREAERRLKGLNDELALIPELKQIRLLEKKADSVKNNKELDVIYREGDALYSKRPDLGRRNVGVEKSGRTREIKSFENVL